MRFILKLSCLNADFVPFHELFVLPRQLPQCKIKSFFLLNREATPTRAVFIVDLFIEKEKLMEVDLKKRRRQGEVKTIYVCSGGSQSNGVGVT